MSWIYRGCPIHDGPNLNYQGHSLVIHNNRLWLAYAGLDDNVYYLSGTNDDWGPQNVVTVGGSNIMTSQFTPPRLVEAKGQLYALIAAHGTYDYKMYHWDDNKRAWELATSQFAFECKMSPALLRFGEKVFRVGGNMDNAGMNFSTWDGPDRGWSSSKSITSESMSGNPGLFTLGDKLYVAYPTNNLNRDILIAVYNPSTNQFDRHSSLGDSTASGVAAISANGKAYLAFPEPSSEEIRIWENSGSGWSRSTSPGQLSFDTPALTILQGVLNLTWNLRKGRFLPYNPEVQWAQKLILPQPPDRWMSVLPDSTLLSAMSIPGTHDSSTFENSVPYVPTQRMSFEEQLDSGVRYFDLRCKMIFNTIQTVHRDIPLGFSLGSVLQKFYTWLDRHREEALIVQIKEDSIPLDSTQPFSQAISELISQSPRYWSSSDTTPSLGSLRGKIQLMRRYDKPNLENFGINISDGWVTNATRIFEITIKSGVKLSIQDHYTPYIPESLHQFIEEKYNSARDLLNAATSNPNSSHWYINFTSGYEFVPKSLDIFTARTIAVGAWGVEGVNGRMRENLQSRSLAKVRMGIFVMDYPEAPYGDYISTIIQSNF